MKSYPLVPSRFIIALTLFLAPFLVSAQNEKEEISDWDRTFMPAIQMGYVTHATSGLTGGIMIQTSLEYRDISNFVFRINYDDFNSNMNLEYPLNPDLTFTGRMSFFELIGGVGYRQKFKKHNLTAYVQPGMRNYGYPVFNLDSIQANLDFDSRSVWIMRYSLGYEFAITKKLFLTIEGILSHALEARDYWIDNRWSYGFTFGISAPLF